MICDELEHNVTMGLYGDAIKPPSLQCRGNGHARKTSSGGMKSTFRFIRAPSGSVFLARFGGADSHVAILILQHFHQRRNKFAGLITHFH